MSSSEDDSNQSSVDSETCDDLLPLEVVHTASYPKEQYSSKDSSGEKDRCAPDHNFLRCDKSEGVVALSSESSGAKLMLRGVESN